jgi:hypothetical protein
LQDDAKTLKHSAASFLVEFTSLFLSAFQLGAARMFSSKQRMKLGIRHARANTCWLHIAAIDRAEAFKAIRKRLCVPSFYARRFASASTGLLLPGTTRLLLDSRHFSFVLGLAFPSTAFVFDAVCFDDLGVLLIASSLALVPSPTVFAWYVSDLVALALWVAMYQLVDDAFTSAPSGKIISSVAWSAPRAIDLS